MNQKQSDISTVIIVNKSRQRTIQVKTKHIGRLKLYIAGVSGVILLLLISVFYLRSESNRQEEEKQQLVAQLAKLQGAMPMAAVPDEKSPNKTQNAQAYVQSIEGKLVKINEYLAKRGLKGFSVKAVGGDANASAAKLTDKETFSLYDEYLSRLLHSVAFTPMGYPRVSSLTSIFGYRSDPFNSASAEFHPGIDFQGNRGDDAKCTANGKVVFAGWYGGYGNCVRIAHGNNLETLYGHLSRILVKVGEDVTAGQKIGLVGSTGHSTGNHLHYEVRKNGKAVNPVSYLSLNN